MTDAVPTKVLAIVWLALFLAFLGGVLYRPSVETVMAAGAATIVLLKIMYDYLYDAAEEEAEAMFE